MLVMRRERRANNMPDEDMLRYEKPRRLWLVGVVVAILFIGIVIFGVISRGVASQHLASAADAQAIPTVSVIRPGAAASSTLVLPGDVRAYNEAPIYAQVSGYLKAWYVDIGAHVQAGQVMAQIDTPDIDQQLAQAKANLQLAQANQHLAATTAARWNKLRAQDAVSAQDADDKNGQLAAQTAQVAAATADMQRLQAMETFKRIVAPFDGVVTSRSTDIGALITVGGPNQTPLFTVDDEHALRIYVSVPQVYTGRITPGMTARFTVPEYPGQSFQARLVTTAGAIAQASGTLLIQFQIANQDEHLHPGDYAQVHIALPADAQAIIVPASALMFRDSGLQVAILDADHHVRFVPVTIARDFGTTVELASGLQASDQVINNPPDVLQAGDAVKVSAGPSPGASGAHAPP
jgi:RND family efflux transporter MFP subunit